MSTASTTAIPPNASEVAAPKPKAPDKVRICVDMRQANTAIERKRYIAPTMDDVHKLNGATVFSKSDPRAAYHQLHPDSSVAYKTCPGSYSVTYLLQQRHMPSPARSPW